MLCICLNTRQYIDFEQVEKNFSLYPWQLNDTLWWSVGLRFDVVDFTQLLLDVTVIVFLR